MKYILTCDNHNKRRAIKNVQRGWIIYNIDKNGNYSEPEIDGNSEPLDNLHLCKQCFEKWDNGDLDL